METDEMVKIYLETRKLLEDLPEDKLRGLLNSPMAQLVMEHCVESEILWRKVEQLLDEEYEDAPQEVQKILNRPVETKQSLGDFKVKAGRILSFDSNKGMRREIKKAPIRLAASSKNSAAEEKPVAPVVFSTITVDGSPFELAEDRRERIILLGPAPPDVVEICLGDDCFKLKRIAAGGGFEIVGAGIVKVQRLLKKCAEEPSTYLIRFTRSL